MEGQSTHEERIDRLERAVFGDKNMGQKGMKRKIDEMYDMLIQARGLRGFLFLLIAIGGALAVIKGFLLR